jgi:hypothetical protein
MTSESLINPLLYETFLITRSKFNASLRTFNDIKMTGVGKDGQ